MNFQYSDRLLKEFVKESLGSRALPLRRPSRGNLVLEVRQASGLIQRVVLKESYVTGVLGIKKKRLMESMHSDQFQRFVLREHLLFEGWWDSAKQVLGDSIETVKQKASDGASALKAYGENAKGVIAALWAAVQDENSLDSLQASAVSLMFKRVDTIIRALIKIANRLSEMDLKDAAAEVKQVSVKVRDVYDKIKAQSGWKGLLTAIAGYLGFSFIREKISSVLESFYDSLSKGIENFSKEMSDKAKDMPDDFSRSIEDSSDSDPKKNILNLTKKWLPELILTTLEKLLEEIGGEAAAALAGPLGWIKNAVALFKVSDWVISNLITLVRRSNFSLSFPKSGEPKAAS